MIEKLDSEEEQVPGFKRPDDHVEEVKSQCTSDHSDNHCDRSDGIGTVVLGVGQEVILMSLVWNLKLILWLLEQELIHFHSVLKI